MFENPKQKELAQKEKTSQHIRFVEASEIVSVLGKATGKEIFPTICRIFNQHTNAQSIAIASCNSISLNIYLESFVNEDQAINFSDNKSQNNTCHTITSKELENYKKEQCVEISNQNGALLKYFPNVFKNLMVENDLSNFYQLSWIWENEILAIGFIQFSSENGSPIKKNIEALLSMTSCLLYKNRIENKFHFTQRILNSIQNVTNDAIVLLNEDLNIISWNLAAESMFKYSADEILDKSLFTIIPKELMEKHSLLLGEVFEKQSTFDIKKTIEIIGMRKDKTAFPIELSMKQWQAPHENLYSLVIHDITERKFSEDRMKATINEKVTLLQEIHHRVKNNMQVISSLLYLQGKKIKDEKTKEIFNESMNRVRSMSLIHEKLYRSADFINIYYLKDYINDLVRSLYSSYRIDYNKVKFHVHVDDISLYIDFAVPLGLTINELVSNSLKHAFPKSWEGNGEIKISLTLAEDGMIDFNYKDNGVGLPKDFNLDNITTLGFGLITGFVKDQLGGTINVKRNKGTEFQIKFKKTKHIQT